MKQLHYNTPLDCIRIIKYLAAVIISSLSAYYVQPMVSNNSNAINTVVTIFSILAGFLIAFIALISEPVLKQARNWEELQSMKNTIRSQLLRAKILFFLYLLTLGLALAMMLMPQYYTEALRWLQRCFVGCATFVFLASFTLPGALTRIQFARYEVTLNEAKPPVLRDATESARAERDKLK